MLFLQSFKKGEVSEWLKEHAWKVCIWETVSRVRIPPSPHSPAEVLQPTLKLQLLLNEGGLLISILFIAGFGLQSQLKVFDCNLANLCVLEILRIGAQAIERTDLTEEELRFLCACWQPFLRRYYYQLSAGIHFCRLRPF